MDLEAQTGKPDLKQLLPPTSRKANCIKVAIATILFAGLACGVYFLNIQHGEDLSPSSDPSSSKSALSLVKEYHTPAHAKVAVTHTEYAPCCVPIDLDNAQDAQGCASLPVQSENGPCAPGYTLPGNAKCHLPAVTKERDHDFWADHCCNSEPGLWFCSHHNAVPAPEPELEASVLMATANVQRTCGDEVELWDTISSTWMNAPYGAGYQSSQSKFKTMNSAVKFAAPTETEFKCDNGLKTEIKFARSREEVANQFTASGSASGKWGEASAKFSHGTKDTTEKTYIHIMSTCETDSVDLSGTVKMKPGPVDQCKKDFLGFAQSHGTCFVSGVRRASVMSIVISVESKTSEEKTKVEADVKTVIKGTDVKGGVSNEFSKKLSNYKTSAEIYRRGVDPKATFAIMTSHDVKDVPQALTEFADNLSPKPVSAMTTNYKTLGVDGGFECEQFNPSCLTAVNSDYRAYREKMNAVATALAAASNDPDSYTKQTFNMYTQNHIFWEGPEIWSGNHIAGNEYYGVPPQATTKFKRDLETIQAWQRGLDAWREQWIARSAKLQCSGDTAKVANPFEAQLKTDVYLKGRGLPSPQKFDDDWYNHIPTTDCPLWNGNKPEGEGSISNKIAASLPGAGTNSDNPKSYGWGPALICCKPGTHLTGTGNALHVWDLGCH